MRPTALLALVVTACGPAEEPPLPTPDLVQVPDGEPLRPWVRVLVHPDGIGIEPDPWLRQVPEDAELPPPFRMWLPAPVDASATGRVAQDLHQWMGVADEMAWPEPVTEPRPQAWGGVDVLVDARAPGPLVLEGLSLATRTVGTVQIVGRVGDRPRGVLGLVRAGCFPNVAVVLAEGGAAVVAGERRIGPEGCWMADEAAPAVVGEWLDACRPRWSAVALELGRPADDLACATASAAWDPDHADGARLVGTLGALYALDPELSVDLPVGFRDPLGPCADPARPLAALTEAELDEVCQVPAVREIARQMTAGGERRATIEALLRRDR